MLMWYEGTTQLSDGGRFSGTHTNTLTLSDVQPGDDGRTFRLLAVVNNPPCVNFSADTVLTAAAVDGCPDCANPGDMDGDGDCDLADMHMFTICFGEDVIAAPECACANVDASDDFVTVQDWMAMEPLVGGPN